jgi:hypothetical protein
VRSKVFESLLVGACTSGGDQSSVRTETIWNGSLDSLDDILLLLEVDPLLGTKLPHKLFLLITSIDGDNSDTHHVGVLDSQVS